MSSKGTMWYTEFWNLFRCTPKEGGDVNSDHLTKGTTEMSFLKPGMGHCRKIPWMEEPGRLRSMGSLRVGHNWATSLSLSAFMHWRRKWQPTPVFLHGESHGGRSLVGCSPWGRRVGHDWSDAAAAAAAWGTAGRWKASFQRSWIILD